MLSFLTILLALSTCTCEENPAIQVILTNKGLQYGKHVGAGWIQDKLDEIVLPDVSGEVLGFIDYTLTGIRVSQCDLPEPSVDFYQNATGFKTSVLGLSVAVKGGWLTSCGIIHDGGSFELAVFNVDVTSIVNLGKDGNGHLSVSSVFCDAEVGDARIEFHGGASWIFKYFVKYFHDRIRGEIQEQICPAVRQYIDKIEYHLQAMTVSFQVTPALGLDLPLTSLPVIDTLTLSLPLKGQFHNIKSHKEPPFEAQPFTLAGEPNYMLSVGLSEFTINSALYGYYTAGVLQALITDSMIPPSSPFHLNTSSFAPYVPQLPKLFPGLLMELQVYASKAPVFSFQTGAVKLAFLGVIKACAIQPNTTRTPLFTLTADSKFSGKVFIDSGKLKGSTAMDNFTLTLAASEVGTFKTVALENLVKIGIKMALSKLNEQLATGFVLPRMKQAQLVNSVLKVEKGFVAISSDAEVWPTERVP
ncbi:bactericidal permeability-increasing protein-like isoform 1-T1 [Polymixia lowei]